MDYLQSETILDCNSPRLVHTSPAKVYRPLGTHIVSNVTDIDNFLFKTSKINVSKESAKL